jgi:peptidoglycan/LPS O-acetylase OafA/YrhL
VTAGDIPVRTLRADDLTLGSSATSGPVRDVSSRPSGGELVASRDADLRERTVPTAGTRRTPSATARYPHVDGLRALAVMLVVVAHAGLERVVPGGTGVTVFFVISGFVISNLLIRELGRTGSFDVRSFWLKRFLKIFPPFLLIVVVPSLLFWRPFGIRADALAAQVTSGYNWFFLLRSHHGVMPGSDVTWSLSIEEQFYLLFALAWIAVVRSRRPLLVLTALAGAVCAGSFGLRLWLAGSPGSTGPGVADRIYFGSDTRVEAIAIGILTALLVNAWRTGHLGRAQQVLRRRTTSALLIAAAALLASLVLRQEYLRETVRYSMQSWATALLIAVGFVGSTARAWRLVQVALTNRVVQMIGLASYSIYLIHLPAMDLLDAVTPVPGAVSGALAVPVKVIVGCLPGIAIWQVVEKPFERLRGRLTSHGGHVCGPPAAPVPTPAAAPIPTAAAPVPTPAAAPVAAPVPGNEGAFPA